VELIHWLRQQPAFRELRVLVHSAHVDMLVKAVLHRYQPVAFLSKPATCSELNAAVQTLWRGARSLAAV
jgi:CheY-like chemotaxis protein